jgi:Mrp family chromosome partitioning ATPase
MTAPFVLVGGVRPGLGAEPREVTGPADRVTEERGVQRGRPPPFAIPDDVRAAVASIRNHLIRRVGPGASPAIGLASSVTGEGATTTLLLLATSLVESGRRVVAVDANPNRLLGLQALPGRGSLAASSARPRDVTSTSVEGLSLLTGDDLDAVLQGKDPDGWRLLLDGLWARGEMILVDLPPALGSARMPEEALTVMDGVVMVVEAHRTRRETVMRARAELERASNRELLGVVLNGRQYFIPDLVYRHA